MLANTGRGGIKQQHTIANQHIRFLSEESDFSDFSDSIEGLVGDEQQFLKLRQKNRKKKKAISLSKKHSGPVLENLVEGSPKLGNGVKKNYQVCSTHK